MKKQKLTVKHFLTMGLLLAAVLLLPSCGSSKDRQIGIDGYVYAAEEIPLGGRLISDIRVCGDYLYYLNAASYNTLYRFRFDDEAEITDELVAASTSEKRILCYAMGSDASVYYYQGIMQMGADYQMQMVRGALIGCREDGTQLYNRSFDIGEEDVANGRLVSLAVDGQDRAYLLAGNTIYVTDASGEPAGSIAIQEYRPGTSGQTEKLLEGADGRVYYYMYDGSKPDAAVYEILGDGAIFRLERLTSFNIEAGVNIDGSVYGASEGMLYNSGGMLRMYREEEGSWKNLLRWTDSDLGRNPREVTWISEEKLAALYHLWDEGEWKLYLLTRKKAEEIPEREELVLAGIYVSDTLDRWVTEFNQNSRQYHITIEPFIRSEADAARLDAMLVSSNPPDILDMTYMNVMKYADKGMLEDLSPYLDREGMPGIEAYLDNFVEGYTIDGALVGIPKSFYLEVILGRESQVGSAAGWTMEDLYTLSKEYPESRLLSMDSFQYVLEELCADYILEAFIDWEKAECRFDSEEFRELMQWMAGHTGRVERIFADGDYRDGKIPDDMLLEENVFGINQLLRCRALFHDDMTVIGYPTEDGRVYYRGIPMLLLGIHSGSGHKEGAGQFLEFFLGKKLEYELSINREELAQGLEDEMTPEYLLDENGDIWVGSDGKPVPRVKGSYMADGEMIEYYALTREQAEELWNVIAAADFTPSGGVREEVVGIIMEEMRSYLYGEKSLEEVTAIIQNRVRILVQENS